MKNLLIADAGSTKTQWVLLKENGEDLTCLTKGFNPNYNDVEQLLMELKTTLSADFQCDIDSVYYYGTGCGSEKNRLVVADALREFFCDAHIEVTHDMMAAARSVLGNKKGVACILGTGSNACLYDGKNIVRNAVSLGYVIGDEGGGADVGRTLLRDYFYKRMPHDVHEMFESQYQLTRDEFIENVYKKPAPSAYLASFAKFAGQNIDNQYVCDLCYGCFSRFADYHVVPLCDDCHDVGFVGSVAFHFADVLRQCMADKGLNVTDITQNPIVGLKRYHLEMK